jgi:predicted RNA binding protein YcfA (HicA-like mRNA interferase family)
MGVPNLSPVSRRELIRKLKKLGFEGPFPGGKHQWMRRGGLRLTIPNPHVGAIDPGLIRRILRQSGIGIDEWTKA